MKSLVHLLLICFSFSGIASAQEVLESGTWHGDVQLNDSVNLGFLFTLKEGKMTLQNADESIEMSEIVQSGDSFFVKFPFYDSELQFTSIGPVLAGEFINHAKLTNNVFYFRAIKDLAYRFYADAKSSANISGRWQLLFDNEEGVNRSNVAVFRQEGSRITGTVMTPTGDHRYLDGEINGDQFSLSTFNGAFLMVYKGVLEKDGTLRGQIGRAHV